MIKKKLKTVRPLLFKDIMAKEALANLRKDQDPRKALETYVERVIDSLLQEALDQLTGHEKQPVEPLVRVRVFHDNIQDTFNPIR
jgi:uncharacterized protein YPO0396